MVDGQKVGMEIPKSEERKKPGKGQMRHRVTTLDGELVPGSYLNKGQVLDENFQIKNKIS